MSHSESVNVDVDSVGHNSEPTTVETRVSISNVEMSVSNTVENSSIEVNSPVPLDHEDSVLDEVRSEEKLVIPVTTQESISNVRVPLPEKLVIPAIPHNSDNSARDDMEPEERLPVPGVDNSNVMVYPPLKSKTILSSELPIAGAPPLGFQGQQLPPVGTQQPFPPGWPQSYGQPPPPVWPQSMPCGFIPFMI